MKTETKNILWIVDILFWLVLWIWIFGLSLGIIFFLIGGFVTAIAYVSITNSMKKEKEDKLIRDAQVKQARQVLDGKETIHEPTLSKETIVKETIVKEVVMIPCPHCQALMPNTSLYCPNCGAPKRR